MLLERLEARSLLDGASILGDAFDVHQNAPPATLDVLANDVFDPDYAGARRITSVSYGSEGGTVAIADDGRSIRYAPPADFAGGESFVYVVDGQFPGTVNLSIRSPLVPDEMVIPPDGALRTLHVLANDPFWAGYTGPREITSISVSSAGGSVEISPDRRAVLYTPPDENYGRDDFVYIVDGIYPSRVTISIPQTLRSDEYELVQNTPGQFHVLANDPFWPGYSGARRITHTNDTTIGGTLQIAADGQSVLYTPDAGFYGWGSFRYVVDSTYEDHVSVVVHRPVVDDWFQVDQNSTEHLFTVTSNDTYWDLRNRAHDVVDRVTSVVQPESGGTVTISADGQGVLYTPPQGFSGTDTFTYVADGKYEARVTVDVTRPVRDDYFSDVVFQDTPNARLAVLANDFVGNGYTGARLITEVAATENGGQVTIAADGRSLTYTPAPGYEGQDSFTYTVDGQLTAAVSLWVQPLAQGDYYSFCADPTQGPYSLSVLANDHFRRGYPGPGVITGVSAVEGGGQAAVEGGQRILFTPGPTGWSTFRYTVDGQYEATVSVAISGQLAGDSYVVDQNSPSGELHVLGNDFTQNWTWATCHSGDYRGPRRITATSGSEHGGTVTIAADGRSVHYEPPEDFYGSDQFTYTVDGIMQASVQVQVIRRVRDDQFRVPGDSGGEALPVLVNDLFGADYRGEREITSVTATSAGGAATIAADGRSVNYTPAAGFVGTDTFTYTVDGALKAEVRVVVEASRADEFPTFGSLEAYQQFLIDDALARYEHLFGQPAWGGCWICLDGALPPGGAPVEVGSDRTHSETNVQVEGVDEGDIVEFDADYSYVLTDNQVVIVDAWPAEELSVASRVEIEGTPIAEFLSGDRLTVISQVGGGYFYPGPFDPRPLPVDSIIGGPFWPYYEPTPAETIVTVLDVSDRTAPTIVQTTSMEGSYVQSRAIGEFVYVLVRNDQAVAPPPLIITEEEPPENECPAENPTVPPWGQSGTYETRDEYLARITANPGALVEAALPNYSSYGPDGELVRSGLLTEPENILRPLVPDVTSLINVVSFRIAGDEPGLAATSSIYGTGASTVYASLDNFYVFDHDYSAEDGSMTRIMKFDWDAESGGVEFAATTSVAGSILNQFSADERDGYLRIATTVSNQWSGNFSGRAENALFVLAEDEGVFEFVGSMQNLALNETIQSVRYIGEKAFITTFRVIDPLFGIDLSDPTNPRSVGHVTLPGFNSYMQLISDTHLLTVGKNMSGAWGGPTQVSLFDVSDLARPRLIDQYTFERFSTSEAELDHHAFGYFAEHGVLAIPASRSFVERTDEDGDGYRETRRWVQAQELAVLAIDLAHAGAAEDGIRWLGGIEHEGQVRRSGYIDDKLYSIATDSVKVVDVTDPGTVLAALALIDPTPMDPPEDPPVEPPVDPNECPDVPIPALSFPAAQADGPMASAVERAQEHLAQLLGVDVGAPVVVAAETASSPSGGYEIVLRAGERMYLYQARANGSVALVNDNYTFGGEQDTEVWHDVELPRFAAPTTMIQPPTSLTLLRRGLRR
jgi:uncharacterized secreted protein with C-terminal beta-propeller domain